MAYQRVAKKVIMVWFSVVLVFLVARVHCQTTTQDFISIDCGNNIEYTEIATNISYTSDDPYIDSGENHKVASNYITNSLPVQDQTVRSFPTGIRNCYSIKNITLGNKYLLRATFMYGNYDGLQSVQVNKPLLFDLHLGVNWWKTVNISDASVEYRHEVVTVALTNFIWICLINTGQGTPFISALELRPIKNSLYLDAVANQSIAFRFRLNYGPTTYQRIRYPDDPYDRFWESYTYNTTEWAELSTTASISWLQTDQYEVPFTVLQTAVTPRNSPNLTFLQWDAEPGPTVPEYVSIRHFTELQLLQKNESRQFNFYLNGVFRFGPISPDYLIATSTPSPSYQYNHYLYTLGKVATSTLPPILNAVEIYSLVHHPNSMTDSNDINAIMSIREEYKLKGNWSGDPCTPSEYAWSGLVCSNTTSPPRIISINLSYSGLTGTISNSFSKLQQIQSLDLSCNSLTGEIPVSLANLSSLKVLNLNGNNFSGSVPDVLQQKTNSGQLMLTIGSQCIPSSPSPNSKNKTLIIILSVAIGASLVIIAGLAMFIILSRNRRSKRQEGSSWDAPAIVSSNSVSRASGNKEPKLNTEFRQFNFKQLENITNNFSQIIGRGGFGIVYRGLVENGAEVAVKVSNPETTHVNRQFHSEVMSLMQVHHKNLVSLVGYCKDPNHLALVYEYMPQGSFQDHLRGKTGIARVLNWLQRLSIALEAAQGLDYLHTGCMIVHRDVKSSNILLGYNLEVKIADFGLSKVFSSNSTMLMTTLCGTPGYIDPEASRTNMLNEKSDVYSFGVVLLEMVTGEAPIVPGREKVNLVDHVNQYLAKGDIYEIVDPRLRREFDTNSVWKVVDLAIRCTSEFSAQRPTMDEVVTPLKESLVIENRWRSKNLYGESPDKSQPNSYVNSVSLTSFGPSSR